VKKATSAAKKSVRPKKAVPTKAVQAKAGTTRMTVAKATTKAGATKTTSKTAAKTTKKASATKATKVSATRTRATRVTAAKTATKSRATNATAGSRAGGAGVSSSASAQPQRLRVRENERPWTVKELATVRAELEAGIDRLQKEISGAEIDLAGLMRDVGDGAGDDPADAGTATFEREQEISLANNAREVFAQSSRALARLVDGSYGVCESCGSPIGKNRLLAFPRATLCMTCKSKQERR
jgi:RNA polymerase-binding transcription factor DksA